MKFYESATVMVQLPIVPFLLHQRLPAVHNQLLLHFLVVLLITLVVIIRVVGGFC